jgi:hypothetical protein
MADDSDAARRPIASLLSKSEKAQQKVAPGTWQHSMLRDNIKALRLATALMNPEPSKPESFSPGDLQEALTSLASMISRTEKGVFTPGTSQHSLQRNRLAALRLAEELTKAELERRSD